MNMTKTIYSALLVGLLLSGSCFRYPARVAAVGPPGGAVANGPTTGGANDAPGYGLGSGASSGPVPQDYPVAERTGTPNRVISPYGPNFNVIDITGFVSGQLARDPSNNKIFRVP